METCEYCGAEVDLSAALPGEAVVCECGHKTRAPGSGGLTSPAEISLKVAGVFFVLLGIVIIYFMPAACGWGLVSLVPGALMILAGKIAGAVIADLAENQQ